MPIDFPDSPALNQEFPAAGKTWKWNGIAWDAMTAPGNVIASTSNYIIVSTSASATGNGTALRNAYAAAKLFTPNSLPLSATNRAVLLLLPGTYDLATTPLTMDTEFVDLVGVSDDPNHAFITSQVVAASSGTIVQLVDNVIMRNLTVFRTGASSLPDPNNPNKTASYFPNSEPVEITAWSSNGTTASVSSNNHGLHVGDSVRISESGNSNFDGVYNVTNVPDIDTFEFASTVNSSGTVGFATERFDDTYIENCKFLSEDLISEEKSMRSHVEYAGTYRRCFSDGIWSFGGGAINGRASGIFEDCQAGDRATGAFGGFGGTASGTFTNCTASYFSFGGTATGIFKNCTGINGACFGYLGDTSGGTFIDCNGENSFIVRNSNTDFSGTFINCSSTITGASVGNIGSAFTGTMRNCRFAVEGVNSNGPTVGNGAKIFDSTLIATGTGYSITSSVPVTISLSGCRMNKDINPNISNNLGTLSGSYNLIDEDIT